MESKFTEKLEILLRTKPFEDLSIEEEKYVLSLISKEEYDAFSYTLKDIILEVEKNERETKVSDEILLNLQYAFQEKHRKPFYLKSVKLPFVDLKIQNYQAFAAALVLALGIFSLTKPTGIKNVESDYYLSEAEFNKYTQWDGGYSEMSTPPVDDDVTQELMNMRLNLGEEL